MTNQNLAIALGILTLVVAAQFRTRPVKPLAFVWVVLLVARGCVPPGPCRPTAASIAVLIASLLMSAAFGVLRGRTMPLWRAADGTVYRRGDRTTLVLWLATIAAKVALALAAHLLLAEPVNLDALWLGLGVTVAVQHGVLLGRVARTPYRSDAITPPGRAPQGEAAVQVLLAHRDSSSLLVVGRPAMVSPSRVTSDVGS